MAARSTFAVTISDGGSAGFVVRSQLRKQPPNRDGVVGIQVLEQALSDASELDVDVKSAQLAADGGAVGIADVVQILVAIAAVGGAGRPRTFIRTPISLGCFPVELAV